MRRNPGVSSENAARDVYSLMRGKPVKKSAQSSSSTDTGARGSNAPAPPTTSSGTTTEPTEPSTELRKRRQGGRQPKRQRRHADQPIDPNSITLNPPQLFAKKLPPLPEERINFLGGRGRQARTTDVNPPRERRRSRSPVTARVERQTRVGPTQREFRRKTRQQYEEM